MEYSLALTTFSHNSVVLGDLLSLNLIIIYDLKRVENFREK